MNFLNLEYFLAVAKEQNITKAASILSLSQQSLSKHILNLEKELDMVLFDRGARLTLTEAGTCFAANAARILDIKSQMLMQMQDIVNQRNRNIRIGITPTRSSIYLPYILPKFRESFPEVQIQLQEESSEEIFNTLIEGKIDVAIGIEPKDKLNFISYPLCIEDYAIYAAPEILNTYLSKEEIENLNTHPQNISIESFKNCPFLCFDVTKRIGKIFQDVCIESGFKPNIILETKSINTLINLCARGLGITICPSIYFELKKNQLDLFNSICMYPLPNFPMQTNIAIMVQRNRYASRLTREFIRMTKEEFALSQGLSFTEHYTRHNKQSFLNMRQSKDVSDQ